jgi:dTDP-4-dehydrorhamnose 3,5-epimerase
MPTVMEHHPETEASQRPIAGVNVRYGETHADERGEICETWRPSWALHPDPLGMVVFVTIRPGQIRGWVVHHRQDDRVFIATGSAKIVLYDGRASSPTQGCVNVLLLGSKRRAAFTIPAGVYHAFENIGQDDVAFIDMPNRPYEPANPDTSRLPLENRTIPYRWR